MRPRVPLAFAATLVLFAGGMLAGSEASLRAYAAGQDPYKGLDTFARALTQIQSNYVQEIGTTDLIYAALDGIADELDAHTMFFDPDAYQQLLDDHKGRYFGIGIEATSHPEGGVRVDRLIEGGPAEAAGLMVGDRVVRIDGEDIRGLDFQAVVNRIKGPRGEPVTLGVIRGEGEPGVIAETWIEVVRDEIITPSVEAELAEPGLAYVRVVHFRAGTSGELADALDRLAADGPLDGAILDLRDNPGGLLEEAVAMVDLFVGDATVVSTRGRMASQDETLTADEDDDDRDLELVVLVNGGSASASEIVAGALQDMGRAHVIGQPTYGKGSVQSVYEYEDKSALKLTISRYYLPSGRSIEENDGIEPDEIVSLLPAGLDARVALEERLGRLELPEEERDELLALVKALEPRKATAQGPVFRGAIADRLPRDAQLRAALERLGTAERD